MTDTTQLETQIADLNTQLAKAKEDDSVASHFADEDGNVFTDPTAVTDAMLRSTGVAMEARAKNMEGWMTRSAEQIEGDLQSALRAGDHIAVALYAGMLNAAKVLGKSI